MNNAISRKLTIWLSLLLLVNVVYLVFELAFNGRLLNLSSVGLEDVNVKQLEIEGRILSGIGCVLLLWRFVNFETMPLSKAVARLAAILVLAFPVMFFGQKVLVDYLVDKTTAEQRLEAQYLLLMKEGIAKNALQLDEIELHESDLDSAQTRSFLSVIGIMTFFSPDFIRLIQDNADVIIARVTNNEAEKALPDAYEQYRVVQQKTEQSWLEYKEATDKYWQAYADLEQDAERQWVELQRTLNVEWKKVEEETADNNMTKKVLDLKAGIEEYYEVKEQCAGMAFPKRREKCFEKLNSAYKERINLALDEYVEPQYWCHEPETVIRTVRRGQRFVQEKKTTQNCSDLSFEHVEQKVRNIAGGYGSFDEFVNSRDVIAKVRNELEEKGMSLPEVWSPTDKATYLNSYMSQGQQAIALEAEKSLAGHFGDEKIPLDLTADEFLTTTAIQTRLHEAFQPLDEHMHVRLDYSSDEFKKLILLPKFEHEAQVRKAALESEATELADGQAKENEGKGYVRALVVPPVALGFSLFFALLNGVGIMASIPALLGNTKPLLSLAIKALGIAAIVAIPMVNASSLTHTKTFEYFEEQVAERLSPVGSMFAGWVINTEPAVYAIGKYATRLVPPLIKADGEE